MAIQLHDLPEGVDGLQQLPPGFTFHQQRRTVFLGVPSGGEVGTRDESQMAIIQAICTNKTSIRFGMAGSSAAMSNYNILYLLAQDMAERGEVDAFVMMHGDIWPQSSEWVDVLMREFDETNADILSAIVALKDGSGITSTAFDTNRFAPRRLTMCEAATLPQSFTSAPDIVSRFGGDLLVNTGLMVIRLRQPWNRALCFECRNYIGRAADGTYTPLFEPEDWRMSRWAHRRGLRVFATQAVPVLHIGRAAFGSGANGVERDDRNIAATGSEWQIVSED